jgi:hypothetical protein
MPPAGTAWICYGRNAMGEQERQSFTIHAHVSHAVWPGERAICHLLTAPKYMPDMWFLQDGETGAMSDLAPYRFGMFRSHRG